MKPSVNTSSLFSAAEPADLDEMLNQLDPASRKAVTEASTWLIWKQGGQWTAAHQEGLDQWLAESELNQFVFRYVSRARERTIAAVRRSAKVNVTAPQMTWQPLRRRRRAAWVAAAVVILAVMVSALYFHQPGMATQVGEHRTVTLDDGTRVTLNTATRIVVEYSTQQRHVKLLSGEAYFDVSRRPDWPFVVTAGNREVTAVGTAFVVRHEDERIAVTLVEGKVAVTELAQSLNQKTMPASPALILAPGERLTFSGAAKTPKWDRPSVEKLTAWRQGVVNINDMTLDEAVAEMNRYNELKLRVEGPAADIGVGGIFRATDARTFAKALVLTYGLSLEERGGKLVLSGTPRSATDLEFDANRKNSIHLN